MNRIHNPDAVAPPASAYSHAVEIPAGARWLYIAGQVGAKPDGTMAEGAWGQNEWAWKNLIAVLEAADMDLGDLVRINAYVTDPDGIATFREVREQVIGDARPAATLVVVSRLANPAWLVEIEAVAAKA